jgi:hypothetical protein
MMRPRKGIRARLGRRKPAQEDRLADATRLAQAEGREAARRRRRASRAERRREQRDALLARTERLRSGLKGASVEGGRRLRPLGLALERLLGRIAPYVSGALFAPIRIAALLLARLLELSEAAIGWLRERVGRRAFQAGGFLSTNVTPLRTYAVLGGAAAIIVAGAQFADYKAVEVNSLFYEGEVGGVAPAPRTEVETTGSAHLYLMLPVALAALYLLWGAYRGNWRLGRWAGALGLLGVVVSLAVDLPQGLDTGLSGIAFSGSEASLIGGFWAQLSASAVLAACGFAVAAQVRRAAGEAGGRPGQRAVRAPWRRRAKEDERSAVSTTPWRTQA